MNFKRVSVSNTAKFKSDARGATGPMFALMLVPALMLAGGSVDYIRTTRAKSALQAAVDTAALSIAKSNLDQAAGDALLTASINNSRSSIPADTAITTSHVTTGGRTTATASMNFPMTVATIIKPSIQVSVRAVAAAPTPGTAAPVCLLALNRTSPETVRFWGTADLIAPTCTIESKSSSATGMVTGGSATATAARFCSAGGASGSGFMPEVTKNCPTNSDPYASTMTWAALATQGISMYGTCETSGKTSIKSNRTFSAGGVGSVMRFCGGMTIATGATVTFEPGIYIVFGDLYVSSGSTLKAPAGVTFLLGKGGNSYKDGMIQVQGGANFQLTAPTTGIFSGMAVVQPETVSYTGGSTPALTHLIIGGGNIDILGLWYTPQAKVRITGNGGSKTSAMNTNASYFGLIADFIELEGNGQFNLNAGSDNSLNAMPAMTAPAGGAGSTVVKLVY